MSDLYDEGPCTPTCPIVDGKKRPRFVTRTIRGGRVVIFGRVFRAPSDVTPKYDGRLDGMRYCFGIYDDVCAQMQGRAVFLWGTEERARKGPDADCVEPEVVDGFLPWCWWPEVVLPGFPDAYPFVDL